MSIVRGLVRHWRFMSTSKLLQRSPFWHRPVLETAFMNRTEHGPRCQNFKRTWIGLAAAGLLASAAGIAQAQSLPVTQEWRDAAQKVAQAGVPLSDLAPNAPDSHRVQPGDTLWDISKLFLKSPWRWPELWGMNMEQIRNPHLIYPGQVLVLLKSDGRARLALGQAVGPAGTVKLSPRVRSELLDSGAVASIPLHLIGPFLNEAVVFNSDELISAPRIVATQEGRVQVSRGETAYVRGDLKGARDFRVFREAKPLVDPMTREILGYEANYVGTAQQVREGGIRPTADGKAAQIVPATFTITGARQEAGVGDRLSPVPARDYTAFVPHAPAQPLAGQILSIYGEALSAGQNQIVAINRGAREGVERGHVLALWRAGPNAVDRTDPNKTIMKLPDERVGLLFVFRVFDRVSYALIVNSNDPVKPGDRFTQP
jgi:LysM repeat protein